MNRITIDDVRSIIKKTIINEASSVAYAEPTAQEPEIKTSLESSLIDRIKKGDERAMEEIIKKYKGSLYNYLMKTMYNTNISKISQKISEEVKDIVMITFEKAFRNINKYDSDYAFSTWLYRIAKNTAIDNIRKWKKEDNVTVSYHNPDKDGNSREISVADQENDPEQEIEKKEKNKIVRDAIEKMNPKYGQFLKMLYFDGLSYDEIAEKMRVPLSSVKTNIFRAKEQLHNDLKNKREPLRENKIRMLIRNILLNEIKF